MLTAIVSVALAIVLLIVLPRRYSSETKLIVKVGRESVTLDPTATTSQTMLLQKTQEEEINSALEIVYSRRIKEAVVAKLGVEEVIDGSFGDDDDEEEWAIKQTLRNAVSSVGDVLLNIGVRDPISDHERAILELNSCVHVSAPKMSRVISVYAEAKSPEMAQAIANTISEAYVTEHMKISQTKGSYEFFERETNKTAAQLDAAKLEMARFMSERQIVSVESNQELLKNAWNEILANILRLENQEKEIAARFADKHPNRIIVVEQLASARKVLDRLRRQVGPAGGAGVTDDSQLAAVSYEEDAGDSRTDKKSIMVSPHGKSRASAVLPAQGGDMISRIEKLILANNELEKYLERVQSLGTQLELHRLKLEEARLIKEQKANHISNVTIFQTATLNEKPIAPNKALVGLGTLFFCFSLAGAFAVFRDVAIRSKYMFSSSDIERNLKVPVLAKLSPDRSGSERTLKNKRSLQKLRDECSDVIHRFVQFSHGKQAGQNQGLVVGVLSFDKGNGASTVAATLATSCSKEYGIRTILVDADRTGRSVMQRFSLNGAPGLYELVNDGLEVQECLQRSELFDLSLVSSTNKSQSGLTLGTMPASDVLNQISNLRQQFDVVIVDLPPATSTDSLVSIAPLMDHVLLVAESGRTQTDKAVSVMRMFENSDTEILGVILNKYLAEFSWQRNT